MGVTVTPKPALGALDIWIGGNSDAALKRVARYGDGWFPSRMTPQEFDVKMDRLMNYCAEVGREVDRDEAGVIIPSHLDHDHDGVREVRDRYLERMDMNAPDESFKKYTAFGTPQECVRTIQEYVDAGCTKFVLMPVGPVSERIHQIKLYKRDVIPEIV